MENAKRLHGEHQSIRGVLVQLDEMIATPDTTDREQFVTLVERLVADLHRHFAFEEEGGFYSDLAAQKPMLVRTLTQLMRQHDELREQFHRVLTDSLYGRPVVDVAPALRVAIELLRAHEQAETDFVQEAMLTDIGGAD